MIVDLFTRYNEIAMKVREFAYMLRGIAEIALNENEKLRDNARKNVFLITDKK